MSRSLAAVALSLALAPLPAAARNLFDHDEGFDDTFKGRILTAIYEHQQQQYLHGSPLVRAQGVEASHDVGQVAVLKDDGDLVLLKSFVDVAGMGLEFAPATAGYTVSRVDRPVVASAGAPLALSDDSNVAVPLPFTFTYYGKAYTQVFVNSDGDLTFGAGESSSLDRSIGRFLGGPPRIGPLFADLNPSAGGSITAGGDATQFRVTWTGVPQFDLPDKNTFQVTLFPDGRIAFAYDPGLSGFFGEAVIGIAPGAYQGGLTTVDMSKAAGATGGGALAESFRSDDALDAVAVTRKFYATHKDDYQQIIAFTSRPLRGKSYFAYELTVHNTDAGIGDDQTDYSAAFGSPGRLESFVTMDLIFKYPDDPTRVFLGTNNTLSVLGQEVGHRWGAYARFKDGDVISDELLGRALAHWSFFMDTDASDIEGNDIQDLGGGQFKTVAATQRYSALDQYLMGLRPAAEVPPFFFVRNVTGTILTDRGRAPEVGVTFGGTRKDVTIDDVIAAIGPRVPAPGPRPPFRQVFVYIDAGSGDAATGIAKVDKIRAAWEPYFSQAVEGRGTVDTHLN